MTKTVEELLETAKDIIMDKGKRDQISLWKNLFAETALLESADQRRYNHSFRAQLVESVQQINENESRRSRRGGMIRPIIMSAPTGQFIFEAFDWNNSKNPEFFSEEMHGLRNALKAHTDVTHEAMLKETEERQKALQKADKEPNLIAIGIISFVVFGVIRLLIKLYNGEIF